jgi:hypothetical protein
MINECQIGNHLEENRRDQFEVAARYLSGGAGEIHENHQAGQPIFEQSTSGMQVKCNFVKGTSKGCNIVL